MPYYIISKQPVFLSTTKYRELEKIVTMDKDLLWILASSMEGKANIEKSKLMFDALNKIFIENPNDFISSWIEFDLKGKEASENIWDLLYDHCHFNGNSFLTDLRNLTEEIFLDYNHESLLYPMGKVFAINYIIKTKKSWWKSLVNPKEQFIQIAINSDKVYRIVGTLKNFTVYIDNCRLTCAENTQIFFN